MENLFWFQALMMMMRAFLHTDVAKTVKAQDY